MARWEPDARGRLAEAALELYLEKGYEQTTVAEIAARAGLTERTFFRHFPDKREVLFSGGVDLQGQVVAAVAAAPADATPMDAAAAGLAAAGAALQVRRPVAGRRQAVVDANVSLQERELLKMASLTAAMAQALRERGADAGTAALTAEAVVAAFRVGFARWIEGGDEDLARVCLATLADLRAVTAQAPT